MAIKNLPKYVDLRGKLRTKGTYPVVGTAVKDTHVIHHSLTKTGSPEAFANHHIDTNGWPGIAYHFVIQRDGTLYQCWDLNTRTYHAGNTNTRAIGTVLVGDLRKGSGQLPTQEQMETLYLLNKELYVELPNMKITKGHQECPGYSWKNCPGDGWDYRKVINGDLVHSDDKNVPCVPSPLPASHTIQEGDTFWSLAKETGFTVAQLQESNPSVNPSNLSIGMVIKLPSKKAETISKPTSTVKGTTSYSLPNRTFRPGDKGTAVKEIQIALNKLNFNCGTPDGLYGNNTKQAIIRFQKVYAPYEVDGIYGPTTRGKMLVELSKRGITS